MVIFLISIITLFIPVNFVNGEEEPSSNSCPQLSEEELELITKKASLKASTSTVVFNKFVGIFPYPNIDEHTFQIVNTSNETAIGLSSFVGELSVKDQSKRSTTIEYLEIGSFSTKLECDILTKNQAVTNVTIFTETLPQNPSNYKGTIFVLGKNVDPLTVDLELKIRHNPWELFYSTILGIGIAISFGLVLARTDYYKGEKDKISKKYGKLNHINKHIENLNGLRLKIDSLDWKSIVNGHEYFLNEFKQRGDESDFVNMLKWYEETEKDMRKIYLPKAMRKEESIAESVTIENLLPFTNEKPKKLFGKIARYEINRKNIVFGIFSVIAGVPLAIFSTDYFMGSPSVDILIAIGVGFSIYRSKDLPKLFKEYFKPS